MKTPWKLMTDEQKQHQREICKRYRQRHPDRVACQKKAWRDSHKEHIREYYRQWMDAHPNYAKEVWQMKMFIFAISADAYAAHRDYMRIASKRTHDNHRRVPYRAILCMRIPDYLPYGVSALNRSSKFIYSNLTANEKFAVRDFCFEKYKGGAK